MSTPGDRLPTSPERAKPVDGSPKVPPALAGHRRYRVDRLLGAGGMGAVWRAQHLLMDRPVALKVIRPELLAMENAVERFRREVQAAARLNHPNIASAYDAEQAGDTHFLVMEFVDGKTLAEAVKRGPLPVAEACRVVRQAALGLAHAHAVGLVHRDVKPGNLMQAADGTVKVLDFGLVVSQESDSAITGENLLMGTPDYVSPEQAESARAADARSDVYSLGCTLYHLLSGHVPFPSRSTLKKIDAHRYSEPESLTGIPEELAAIVAKMMAKAPAKRFQTAREVPNALAPFCGEVVELPRPRRRWPLFAGVAAALLLVLVGAIYRIQTDDGELVIQTMTDDVEVLIKQGGKEIDIFDTKTQKKLTLRSGIYDLEIKGKPSGLRLDIDKLTLRRGQETVAKIERVPLGSAQVVVKDEVYVFREHKDGVLSVAISPDGLHVLSAGNYPKKRDPSIKLWDLRNKVVVQQFHGHRDNIYSVAFSRDGKRAVSAAVDKSAIVWDVQTGQILQRLTHQAPLLGAAFTPDGKQVITTVHYDLPGQIGRLRLWDVATGKEINRFAPHQFRQMRSPVLSSDGRTLAVSEWEGTFDTVDPGEVGLWDLASGKLKARFQGHKSVVYTVRFSPDDKTLLTTSLDGTARIWDVASAKLTRTLAHGRVQVFAGAFSPAGQYFVTAGEGDHHVRLYSTATGKELHRFHGHEDNVHSLAFTPDGRWVVSGSEDRTVRVWKLPLPFVDPPPVKLPLRAKGESPAPSAPKFVRSPPLDAKKASEMRKLPGLQYLPLNSIGMQFVAIPRGKFMMGSPPQEIERLIKLHEFNWPTPEYFRAEGPEHEVEITEPFYMGVQEVTYGQFRSFVDETPYNVGDDRWRRLGELQSDDHPVAAVSWHNAVAFCEWLSKKEGKTYRLPTEAEWEYCCRAGKSGRRYSFGNDSHELVAHAWIASNSLGSTQKVGQLKPNDWGLHDMHGNVWEWCQDEYSRTYYSQGLKVDPVCREGGRERVFRGGAFDAGPGLSRTAFRLRDVPEARGTNPNLGFRVVLEANRNSKGTSVLQGQ